MRNLSHPLEQTRAENKRGLSTVLHLAVDLLLLSLIELVLKRSSQPTYENLPFLLFIVRSVYQRADKALRNAEEKEERVMLLEAWKEFEVEIYVRDNPRLLYPPVADFFPVT